MTSPARGRQPPEPRCPSCRLLDGALIPAPLAAGLLGISPRQLTRDIDALGLPHRITQGPRWTMRRRVYLISDLLAVREARLAAGRVKEKLHCA